MTICFLKLTELYMKKDLTPYKSYLNKSERLLKLESELFLQFYYLGRIW